MSRHLILTWAAAALLVVVGLHWARAQSSPSPRAATKAEAKALAARLDTIIAQKLQRTTVAPGPKADPAQLARRLHLDLTGTIPQLAELLDFLDGADDLPAKVEERVDALLGGDAYAPHFAHYWRSVLLTGPQATLEQRLQFEDWLHNRLAANTGYDKMAHEVLTDRRPWRPGAPTASDFSAVNDDKAEKLAGVTSRVFLGHKIECAECHDDKAGRWTRQQFWEFAAFFAPEAPPSPKAAPSPKPQKGEIRIPRIDRVVRAKFINGEEPIWRHGVPARVTLADWVTSPENPYFAKAAVSHLWQYFFGVSLVEPVFEPEEGGPPAHPELLDTLARAFIDSGFDLKFLIRAIVLTDAYQRASVAQHEDNKRDIQMFARMPVRGMMPEQLFDSVCVATDFHKRTELRGQFLAKFAGQDNRLETQTSALQALYLMNGPFMSERCRPEENEVLRSIATGNMSMARRVETLYLVVLSRPPRPEEAKKLVRYIDSVGTGNAQQAVADVYWALLNTPDFRLIQ
jgi:Protein of unknown function (DUF1549)/Protein of unknown function (DUF1553)